VLRRLGFTGADGGPVVRAGLSFLETHSFLETPLMKKSERIEKAIRDSVISYMSWSGSKANRLSRGQWSAVYLLGDGFGKVDQAWAEDQSWDWSHIRDSSPKALERMWNSICHFELANSHLGSFEGSAK
jgi:hypothetical protein